MIEVEVKLPIYRRSTTEKALREMGFSPLDLIRESDIYFTSDFHDFMVRDEALRIRSSENLTLGTCSYAITYKGPKMDSVSMTRKELETGIEDPEIGRNIFIALGYRELTPVNKLRQYYQLKEIHACVDQVEKLGSFLELEILAENEEARPAALKKIETILDGLGYSLSETTRYSYLYMLQRKNGWMG